MREIREIPRIGEVSRSPVHDRAHEGRVTRGFSAVPRLSLNSKDYLAEREGFEPSVPGKGYARLAIWCLRPLGHLSA